MNVLITGGAGYIGSHVNKYLSRKGHNTIVVDDLSFGKEEAVRYGKFFNMDFSDPRVELIFKTYNIDAVVHLAALADVGHSVIHPDVYYLTNVVKTLKLLDMMVHANIKHIVFSSTAAIFGEPVYTPIDEKHPQKPINPYGNSKLVCETILEDYSAAYGIYYTSLRYFNASGCDPEGEIGEAFEPPHHIIPIIMRKILSNKCFHVFGSDYNTKDGTCIRDYVHVWDIADLHDRCLGYIMENGVNLKFNVGNSSGFSNLEIINEIEKVTGQRIEYGFQGRRKGDPAVLIASNKKVCEFFNWKPGFSDISTIITSSWNWEQNRKY
ncbi:MAG TPA: UDP-glucose 4-epimerase GalE [Ignavibacteriales bacterium]|nr:UDP-glucose 4-epimerase GalE [Ignavibacteriales bacterium]